MTDHGHHTEPLTAAQRHHLTCPLCEEVTESGVALDAHLTHKHGLDREGRFEVYKTIAAAWKERVA